jgi:hypothetical protein
MHLFSSKSVELQTRPDEQTKISSDGAGLRDSFAPDGIHDGSSGQFNVFDNKPAMQPKIFELVEVDHSEIQTSSGLSVHRKMNRGKNSIRFEQCQITAAAMRDKIVR